MSSSLSRLASGSRISNARRSFTSGIAWRRTSVALGLPGCRPYSWSEGMTGSCSTRRASVGVLGPKRKREAESPSLFNGFRWFAEVLP